MKKSKTTTTKTPRMDPSAEAKAWLDAHVARIETITKYAGGLEEENRALHKRIVGLETAAEQRIKDISDGLSANEKLRTEVELLNQSKSDLNVVIVRRDWEIEEMKKTIASLERDLRASRANYSRALGYLDRVVDEGRCADPNLPKPSGPLAPNGDPLMGAATAEFGR